MVSLMQKGLFLEILKILIDRFLTYFPGSVCPFKKLLHERDP